MVHQILERSMYIPYGRQSITKADIKAVTEVLKSDFLTQGPVVPKFEERVAAYCGVKYTLAVNSATSALHIACMALDVVAGDRVWTTPISFVASANCARYCGADVDFVDIDPETFNMSVSALESKLEDAKRAGSLPKVVIPVHMCGQSPDMKKISKLAKLYGFKVIEDASHAIGARYAGKPVGSCQYSDITVFSFHPVKIITTGEGGMALTNDPDLMAKMARLRSHGITRDPALMTREPDGLWYYEQLELGYNYRMTDIQAALGLSQMDSLDGFIDERRLIADRYAKLMSGLDVELPVESKEALSSYHLYVVRVDSGRGGASHRDLFARMRMAGIGVNLHYIPIYRQPYYQQIGYDPAHFPHAENYYSRAISIPIYPGLTESQQKEVVRHFARPQAVGYQTIF